MPRPVLNYESQKILRGDAPRAIRSMGGVTIFLACMMALAFWLFVKDSRAIRIAVWLVFVGLGCLATICMAIISRYTMAEIHDGKINFYFCGLRTRSIPLDADTTLELRKVGRLKMLVINRGPSSYVPNGALDRQKLVDLLRAHGIAEAKVGNAKGSYWPDE